MTLEEIEKLCNEAIDSNKECEFQQSIEWVEDYGKKLLAVAKAASALPIKEHWNEEYCTRADYDQLHAAHKALEKAIAEFES